MRKLNWKKTVAVSAALALCVGTLAGCGSSASSSTAASSEAASSTAASEVSSEEADEVAAKNVADLIDAIYVQERNDDTDAQCEAAKAAWDALTDTQKELVEGENADPDMTAMAIQALAPYYKTNETVKAAVDKALEALSALQRTDGGFGSWGTVNSESCAQVIVALTALGIDPIADSRFVKNGLTVLDALSSFYVTGGGFRHTAGGDLDGMATEQGYYALAAYYRFANAQTRLYDMTDVTIQTGGSNTPATGDTGVLVWIIALPVAALAAAFVLKRKEREA